MRLIERCRRRLTGSIAGVRRTAGARLWGRPAGSHAAGGARGRRYRPLARTGRPGPGTYGAAVTGEIRT